MNEISYTAPIIVSGVFTSIIAGLFLYKTENSVVMRFLSDHHMKNLYIEPEIQKDTRNQDLILLIVLVFLILALGVKLILFQVIISDSMKPQFERGDLVLSQSIFKEANPGDIITFKSKFLQNSVTHRLIGYRGNFLSTKGDNNPIVDDYQATKEDILSKVVMINGQPVVIKGVGSYFILDFSKEGQISKYGDQFKFMQQMFLTIRTWGYVITAIAFIALLMSMAGNKT